MAIIKRNSRYQVKLQSQTGEWVSKTFTTLNEARLYEAELKIKKSRGENFLNRHLKITVKDFFHRWDENSSTLRRSEGWRKTQLQMFRDYIDPVIGHLELKRITPQNIQRILKVAQDNQRRPQTLLHIYGFLRKLFNDAQGVFELVDKNPVLKRFKPSVPQKESKFLTLGETKQLLEYVRGKEFEIAIWLGLFCGLRVGEIQALKWENVDLSRGLIHIRANYVRREGRFKDYPKGKKWHSVHIPGELWTLLRVAFGKRKSDFVVVSPQSTFLNYDWYLETLKAYCVAAGVPKIGTHGLRHTASVIYMEHGASKEDMRELFAHSSIAVTERYVHGKGPKLEKIANDIVLFPEHEKNAEPSQNLPKWSLPEVDS